MNEYGLVIARPWAEYRATQLHEDARLDEDEAESQRDTPRSADEEAAIAAGDAAE